MSTVISLKNGAAVIAWSGSGFYIWSRKYGIWIKAVTLEQLESVAAAGHGWNYYSEDDIEPAMSHATPPNSGATDERSTQTPFTNTNVVKVERVYTALGGQIGEYRGYGTVWASSAQEAEERFRQVMPAERYKRWKQDNGFAEPSLGNSNRRKLDANGNVVYQTDFPGQPTYEYPPGSKSAD